MRIETKAMIAVLLAFIILASAASIINPLHEATDELRHYRFVRYVAQEKRLPVQGQLPCRVQGHHPPLYYTLAALATAGIDTGQEVCAAPPNNPFWAYRYWEVGGDNKNQYLHDASEAFPWHGAALAAHIARAVNVLLGAGVVWLTWLIGRAIWPQRPFLALGGAAFVAFNPMFVYMSGAINNDILAALSGTAVTLAAVRLLQDEKGLSRRWGIWLGALFGLALMSKFNLAAMALLIETAVIFTAGRKKQWRLWLEVNLLIAGMTLLIAGWWFVRNQLLFGEPTGVRELTKLWGVRNPAESWGVALFELPYAWSSLWGRFGYGQIPLPEGIYTGLKWVTAVAFLGLLLPFIRRQKEEIRHSAIPLLFLLLNVILFFSVLFFYLLISPAGPMGRFFFPALPSLSILIFYGLSQLTRSNEKGARNKGQFTSHKSQVTSQYSLFSAIAVNIAMAALTAIALFAYLAPAYARPPTFAADTAVPHPINAQFDSFLILRGYEISQTAVHPGDPLDIDLYWEVIGQPPGNYLYFVHLIDDAGMVVQRDTHPGLGNFPSGQWQPGDRFVESIRLYLPETAYSPATADLSIGLYAPEGYRLGITAADGTALGDALTVGTIAIEPTAADYPNPLDQNFNGEIRLVGYAYDQRLLQAGEELAVTLYWQAPPALNKEYIVQIQLLDENGAVRREENDDFSSGQSTTTHKLRLPPDLPPGFYRLRIALLDAASKKPHNIIADDGHWINDHLLLAGVRVGE